MELYKPYNPYDDKAPRFVFKLMVGYYAIVTCVYSYSVKNHIVCSWTIKKESARWWRRQCKKAKRTTRKTFCKWVGQTPEQMRDMLLRRLQRELMESIKKAETIKAKAEKDIRYMRLVRNRAKKAEKG